MGNKNPWVDRKFNGIGSATIFTKEPTVRIQCQSGSMLITIKDAPANLNGQFSGMVYPKGLAKNSTCLTEYHEQEGPLRYKLPLKSCNTMPIETIIFVWRRVDGPHADAVANRIFDEALKF
uniref:ZP domain-containing protein n=1 Tax=Anopheles maculatus TaxID=74869 RepID=A0A182T5J2_9DIPT